MVHGFLMIFLCCTPSFQVITCPVVDAFGQSERHMTHASTLGLLAQLSWRLRDFQGLQLCVHWPWRPMDDTMGYLDDPFTKIQTCDKISNRIGGLNQIPVCMKKCGTLHICTYSQAMAKPSKLRLLLQKVTCVMS